MSEDNGNGKLEEKISTKPEFKHFVIIRFNDENGNYAFETNVPNAIIGYGMLEFAKKGVDNHIAKARERAIQPVKGGIMNFVRGIKK